MSKPKPEVHIFLLSRLAYADVTDWLNIIKDLKQGQKPMYWSYKPLREGAYAMASKKPQDTSEIYASVGALAQQAGGPRCRTANVNALKVFEAAFLPKFTVAGTNFMKGKNEGVEFGPVTLVGGPHFSVKEKSDQEKLVYLHPSRWTEEQVGAFCELLTVVAEKRFHSEAKHVWFLDLRNGERVPWNASRKLVRKKCEKAAEFLVGLQAASLTEDET
jgi:hypothetical protein